MLPLNPVQEAQVCDALVHLGWLASEHALHGEGVRAIRGVLQCSSEDAIAVVQDLRVRKSIAEECAPDAQQGARFRWTRPTAHR